MIRLPILLAAAIPLALVLTTAHAASVDKLASNAEKAIASGHVVPERDLAPLIQVLRAPPSTDELRNAIDEIETLADARGSSPAEVKHYLLEQSTPLLLKIGADGPSAFARGDAVTALRDMGASRSVLEQAATIAENDPDDYVKSRGEILRNFIQSMPDSGAAADVQSDGGAKEQKAIAALKTRKLGVSADQLRTSSLEGNPADVKALLDAGVNVNSGSGLNDRALYFAVFSGCGGKQGETPGLIDTVNILIAAGAEVHDRDDNGNTILMSAAQMCGGKIVGALIAAGADVNLGNGSGMNPLSMALLMKHPDAAEVLVSKGAKLSAQQVQMLSASATDARSKAIIQKATK
ncbi:MAG: ankyrin repeat domain-containing protein [Rhodanobacteraceae bacterium]